MERKMADALATYKAGRMADIARKIEKVIGIHIN